MTPHGMPAQPGGKPASATICDMPAVAGRMVDMEQTLLIKRGSMRRVGCAGKPGTVSAMPVGRTIVPGGRPIEIRGGPAYMILTATQPGLDCGTATASPNLNPAE
jgi:hypothetical protein